MMDSPERILVWHTPEKGLYKEREGEGTRGGRGKRGERGREIERRVLGPVTFISRRSKAPFPPFPFPVPPLATTSPHLTPSGTLPDCPKRTHSSVSLTLPLVVNPHISAENRPNPPSTNHPLPFVTGNLLHSFPHFEYNGDLHRDLGGA